MTTPKKTLIGKLTYSESGRRSRRSSEKKVVESEGGNKIDQKLDNSDDKLSKSLKTNVLALPPIFGDKL